MWWTDLRLFFFPVLCLVCGKRLSIPGEILCLECEYNLPKTEYRDSINNPVVSGLLQRINNAKVLFRNMIGPEQHIHSNFHVKNFN